MCFNFEGAKEYIDNHVLYAYLNGLGFSIVMDLAIKKLIIIEITIDCFILSEFLKNFVLK